MTEDPIFGPRIDTEWSVRCCHYVARPLGTVGKHRSLYRGGENVLHSENPAKRTDQFTKWVCSSPWFFLAVSFGKSILPCFINTITTLIYVMARQTYGTEASRATLYHENQHGISKFVGKLCEVKFSQYKLHDIFRTLARFGIRAPISFIWKAHIIAYSI